MDEYCNENGFAAWFETSARDNINIDDAARCLVEKVLFHLYSRRLNLLFLKFTPLQVLEKDTVINNDKKGDQFSITGDSNSQTNANKCSC